MFYGRRRRLEEITEAEAKGRSFWTNKLDERARARLYHAVDAISSRPHGLGVDLLVSARQESLADLGLYDLSGVGSMHRYDALSGISSADENVVFSLIEALITNLRVASSSEFQSRAPEIARNVEPFVESVRTILREHRVKFDIIRDRSVPLDSLEMHEAVVVPTLSLLGGRKDFARVEVAYPKTLEELHTGTPDNAITDAATALQEALLALGCKRNSLGPLANSAQSLGLITGYDRKLISWVSADRNNKGNAHNVDSASTEDAWLVVHVVGALILRIVRGPLRGAEGS